MQGNQENNPTEQTEQLDISPNETGQIPGQVPDQARQTALEQTIPDGVVRWTISNTGEPTELLWTSPNINRGTTILPRLEENPSGLTCVVENRQRYAIQKKIGEGGAGEVELVMDKDIHRLVAVKRLKKNLHNSMMMVRFVDEIRTVGHLEHPNIVPIHDVGIDEKGQYYFVMKYIEGETLQSIIEKLKSGNPEYHKKYTFQYRTAIFSDILKAVEFAHHNGIIHRDIKPANIMVGNHGEVTVMDWGISKRLKGEKGKKTYQKLLEHLQKDIRDAGESLPQNTDIAKTMDDTAIGTPAYMAPEQIMAKSDRHDERTDIYSLSALFYEFLSLRSYLKPAESLQDLLADVIREVPPHPFSFKNRYQKTVPADLGYFVLKGLEKEPAKRFQSISEMQSELMKILEGYNHIYCTVTFTKRFANAFIHFVNNHPMPGVFLFMFLASLVLGGAYAFISYIYRLL